MLRHSLGIKNDFLAQFCSAAMVTMNSEQSAGRRRPGENDDAGGTGERCRNGDDQCNNENGEAVDDSPNSPTYHITASCAEDTPNYLVYQKVIASFVSIFKLRLFPVQLFSRSELFYQPNQVPTAW